VSTTTRIPALISYLVAEFQAAATLGQATPPVVVFDGPAVSADPVPLALYVGVDDAFGGSAAMAADSQQTALGLATKREELATIHCCAVAWAGTDDLATVRTSAFAIAGAVEDLVRSDVTTMFQPGSALARPGVTSMVLMQDTTTTGATAQVAFQIIYKALIGN
jgi:hypothetical protein